MLLAMGAPSVSSQANYCRDPDGAGDPWCLTTDPNVRWQFCDVPKCKECYTLDPFGRAIYWAQRAVTVSGRTCQRWDTQIPQRHDKGPMLLALGAPDLASQSNFCRDPDGKTRTWCYTNDPNVRWEFCGVPQCRDCYRLDARWRAVYWGQRAVTQSGRTCQRWDAQTPHNHTRGPMLQALGAPNASSQANYCRDPDGEGQPWCYTTDPRIRWDLCNISECCLTDEALRTSPSNGTGVVRIPASTDEDELGLPVSSRVLEEAPATIQAECYSLDRQGRAVYWGQRATTQTGRTCQRWDSQNPQQHTRGPMLLAMGAPSVTSQANYCRDPDGNRQPWCYTTDPRQRWEYCSISACPVPAGVPEYPIDAPVVEETPVVIQAECYRLDRQGRAVYWGQRATTQTGRTCQRWDSQSPHQHTKGPMLLAMGAPSVTSQFNYCRDPDGIRQPWCYTTDPRQRWENCSIPACPVPAGVPEFPVAAPVMEETPVVIQAECYRLDRQGRAVYWGQRATTQTERTCQRWDSQSPHQHTRGPMLLAMGAPSVTSQANYCRDPDGNRQPWCYTSDPRQRWEYCAIPSCYVPAGVPEFPVAAPVVEETPVVIQAGCYRLDRQGRAVYWGQRATTQTGKTCQRWDSQSPHQHTRGPMLLAMGAPSVTSQANYCRDPDGNRQPWCYTTNPRIRWENCSIPACSEPAGVPEFPVAAPVLEETPVVIQAECYRLDRQGRAVYWGQRASTQTGKTCQSWDSQSPHQHTRGPMLLAMGAPSVTSQANYCRDPDGNGQTWCYTTDPLVRWENCSIPSCPAPVFAPEFPVAAAVVEETPVVIQAECYRLDRQGRAVYWGQRATTQTGKTCQRWDSQSPHQHTRGPMLLAMGAPSVTSQANYCRDPDGNSQPWCYITDPQKRWENCSIPTCPVSAGAPEMPVAAPVVVETPVVIQVECFRLDRQGRAVYWGQRATTQTGKTCQRWDSQNPHQHTRGPMLLVMGAPSVTSQVNYCRDPDGNGQPWCYTTNPQQRWENCGIPSCPGYPTLNAVAIPGSQGENQPSPPEAATVVEEPTLMTQGDCYTLDANGRAVYWGERSQTVSNRACQRWDSQTPHRQDRGLMLLTQGAPNVSSQENHCRDPDGLGRPWCYTMDTNRRWEECNVIQCPVGPGTVRLTESPVMEGGNAIPEPVAETTSDNGTAIVQDCYILDESGRAVYWGERSVTTSRHTCQRWDSQEPHRHDRGPMLLAMGAPDLASQANYCRDPDGGRETWCYTTNASVRWESCQVPQCPIQPVFGGDPGGEVTIPIDEVVIVPLPEAATTQNETAPQAAAVVAEAPATVNETAVAPGRPSVVEEPVQLSTAPSLTGSEISFVIDEVSSTTAAEDCYRLGPDRRAIYWGQLCSTVSERKCQRWDSQSPHPHNMGFRLLLMGAPTVESQENYCRDPSGRRRPWCFTTDPAVEWEYCDMDRCY